MKQLILLSLLLIFSCTSQEKKQEDASSNRVVEIINKVNIKLKATDFSPKAVQEIAKDGLPMFESFIKTEKNISKEELSTWIEMYRGLENYAFKSTENSDKFIEEMIASKSLGETLTPQLKLAYHNLIYFAELPENTNDTDGNSIKISDYNDKLVLIDFWATWCGPCIGELPNVKKAYNKYKSKGFDIVGISLDSDLEKLKNFTVKKEMPWRQVSDGKQWSSAFARHYGINSIPATFLLKNGKVVAKNLRGADLEKAIIKYL